VVPDDVKRLAPMVLSHRVILKGFLRTGQREAAEALIRRLVEQTAVPE
jgi:MoxR-like ATPase